MTSDFPQYLNDFNRPDKPLLDILKYVRSSIVALLIDSENDQHKRQILSNLIHDIAVVIEKHEKEKK